MKCVYDAPAHPPLLLHSSALFPFSKPENTWNDWCHWERGGGIWFWLTLPRSCDREFPRTFTELLNTMGPQYLWGIHSWTHTPCHEHQIPWMLNTSGHL